VLRGFRWADNQEQGVRTDEHVFKETGLRRGDIGEPTAHYCEEGM
jgi:hypothetical protein